MQLIYINFCTLKSGDKLAFQSQKRDCWLGCANHCGSYSCPGMYFEGEDWLTWCGGEIFQIYDIHGFKTINSGNPVGIYFPGQSKWLGCSNTDCQKYDCPGSPTIVHGFSTPHKWHECLDENFFIYGRNVEFGSAISYSTDVLIFHPNSQQWLSLIPDDKDKTQTCPGTVRPPLPLLANLMTVGEKSSKS